MLRYIEIDPTVIGRDLQPVDLRPERRYGFLSLRLPSGAMAEGTARHVLGMLHGFIAWDIRETHPTSPLIHGATIRIGERRIVVMGSKGSGKTTLTLALLAAGYEVEGDEHLVIDEDSVIARPRTLRVKPGSFALVPAALPLVPKLPSIEGWDGDRIYSVDPQVFGRPWTIAPGQLDGLVFIAPNHNGRSVLKSVSPNEAFRRLMANVHFAGVSPLLGTVRLRSLAVKVPAFELRLGDLSGAELHLRQAFRD